MIQLTWREASGAGGGEEVSWKTSDISEKDGIWEILKAVGHFPA